MENYQILLLIAAVVAGFVLATVVFVPMLKKKYVNTPQIIGTVQDGLATADTILDGVQAALPGLPGITVVDKVIELAQKGVNAAEQLYKSAQVPKEERKTTAVQLVKDCLTAANVEITPDIEKIIDGAVEAAVFTLPTTGAAAA